MEHGSDEQTYLRFLEERDESALEELLERYRERLTLFLCGYVRSMEDAEDVMIETFAEIASRERWSSEGSSFRTWLFAIGRKKALMLLRRQKRRPVEYTDGSADGQSAPDTELLREERDRQLYRAMEQLKPEYRQVLRLLYFEQMTHEEAAQVMRKTRKQIYHLADRGRKRLGEILKGMDITDAGYE